MLLTDKTAILYGAAGHIGRAVAQSFAREGARLFLAGRDSEPLEGFAEELKRFGGRPGIAKVDALDAKAVEEHFAATTEKAGGGDISFNMISLQDVQGRELTAMSTRRLRVRWALEEVGLPYEVRLLSFKALKEPAHRALINRT